MSSYCLNCRISNESKNPKVSKTKNGRMVLLSSAVFVSKKLRFINPIQDGKEGGGGVVECEMTLFQFFPCNFYKIRKKPQKLSC